MAAGLLNSEIETLAHLVTGEMKMRLRPMLAGVVALALAPLGAMADPVSVPAGSLTLTADLALPVGAGPFPVVVALHGCNGMRGGGGRPLNARHRDWNARLLAAGFAVLALDSFSARGITEVCTLKTRPITPRDRAGDVAAALAWLAARADVDAGRLVLLGWSHGGSTVLRSVSPGALGAAPKPALAIAYYPGCSPFLPQAAWKPTVPLTILMGALDDWTPAAPCRDLAAHAGIRYVEYPGAYHAFDAPNLPVRVRTGLGLPKDGQAHVGTDPAARAASLVEVMALLAPLATRKAP